MPERAIGLVAEVSTYGPQITAGIQF
jgi:hypothetical protein